MKALYIISPALAVILVVLRAKMKAFVWPSKIKKAEYPLFLVTWTILWLLVALSLSLLVGVTLSDKNTQDDHYWNLLGILVSLFVFQGGIGGTGELGGRP